MAIEVTDRVVYRKELTELLKVSSESIRRYIKRGKLPKPDVELSKHVMGWKLSTLKSAGISLV